MFDFILERITSTFEVSYTKIKIWICSIFLWILHKMLIIKFINIRHKAISLLSGQRRMFHMFWNKFVRCTFWRFCCSCWIHNSTFRLHCTKCIRWYCECLTKIIINSSPEICPDRKIRNKKKIYVNLCFNTLYYIYIIHDFSNKREIDSKRYIKN